MPNNTLRITLIKSPIGFSVRHKATVKALGLHRMRQTRRAARHAGCARDDCQSVSPGESRRKEGVGNSNFESRISKAELPFAF